jgi:hypothetical protein
MLGTAKFIRAAKIKAHGAAGYGHHRVCVKAPALTASDGRGSFSGGVKQTSFQSRDYKERSSLRVFSCNR